jgi:hypothetical protein
MSDLRGLLRDFNLRPPAAPAAIRALEEAMRSRLPTDYAAFLALGNGGEGFVGENSYAMLWGVDELLHLNEAYQVQEYAPGLLLIGSDGGGEAFAFDTRESRWPVVRVPFVGMDLSLTELIGRDFMSFLEHLHSEE